jgi:hypothetical protein
VNIANLYECYFYNNSNLKGGGIYFAGNEKYQKNYFWIEKTIFVYNDAGEGGSAMHFSQSLPLIEATILNCFFFRLIAWSNNT